MVPAIEGHPLLHCLRWLLFMCMLCLCAVTHVQAASHTPFSNTLLLSEDIDHYPAGEQLAVLEDPAGTARVDDLVKALHRFEPSAAPVPALGYTSSTYWLSAALQHLMASDQHWVLDISYPALQMIDVYLIETSVDGRPRGAWVHLRGGSLLPMHERPLRHRTHAFPLELKANTHYRLLVRVESESSMTLPLTLWRGDAFAEQASEASYGFGIYAGIMLGLIAYNLFLYQSMREQAYAHYILFMASILLFQMSFSGLTQLHLWPDHPQLCMLSLPLSIGMMITFSCWFAILFLNTASLMPRLHAALLGVSIMGLVTIVTSVAGPYHVAIKLGITSIIPGSILLLAAGILAWIRKAPSARYYLLAWSMLLIGSTVQVLRVLGVLSTNVFTEYSLFIGSALEAILLSVALAGRMKQLLDDKQSAQINAMENKQLALSTISSYSKRLEQEVSQRTSELVAAQQQLVQRQKMAALGVMTAGVAHEINNPNNFISVGIQNAEAELNRLHMFIEDLLDHDADPDIGRRFNEHFRKIAEQHMLVMEGSQRIAGIVTGLDSVTQLNRAEQRVMVITEGLQETLRLLEGKHSESITFQSDIQPCRPTLCWPAELNQAFMNILVNATQAIEQRQRTEPALHGYITVNSEEVTEDEQRATLIITITDNGCGMTPDVLAQATDPFFTTREVGSGVGLGLSISRDVIEKHGGILHLISTSGQGSHVTIELPLREESPSTAGDATP